MLNIPVNSICLRCAIDDIDADVFIDYFHTSMVSPVWFTDNQYRTHKHDPNIIRKYLHCAIGHQWEEAEQPICEYGDYGGKI